MTYEEFLQEVKKITYISHWGIKTPKWGGKTLVDVSQYFWGSRVFEHKTIPENVTEIKEYLVVETHVSGTSGASCWNDARPAPYISDNKIEELESLDIIFEKFFPNISMLQYKKFRKEHVESFTREEGDYYGNTSSYVGFRLKLEDVYNFLVENKCL